LLGVDQLFDRLVLAANFLRRGLIRRAGTALDAAIDADGLGTEMLILERFKAISRGGRGGGLRRSGGDVSRIWLDVGGARKSVLWSAGAAAGTSAAA
jgi:hypothetical protein